MTQTPDPKAGANAQTLHRQIGKMLANQPPGDVLNVLSMLAAEVIYSHSKEPTVLLGSFVGSLTHNVQQIETFFAAVKAAETKGDTTSH